MFYKCKQIFFHSVHPLLNLRQHVRKERVVVLCAIIEVDRDILVGKVTPKGESVVTPEEKLLRAMDFQYQTLTREQTETGAVQIRTSQTLLGVPVLGSQLALTYTDDCLTAVEGTFYTGGSSITRVSEQEAISAADALAQLLARRDALGWGGSAVTGRTQAYLPSDQAGTGIRFVPVWLVETDAGSFFINGITREITAET